MRVVLDEVHLVCYMRQFVWGLEGRLLYSGSGCRDTGGRGVMDRVM